MEQNYSRFKNYKELDIFIQNSLDKYFYVEPWKKLYERTGKLHRDIISDKSTIPDLIIYNKTFNKSDCFIGSKEKSYIKFPRMRFILRPKYKSTIPDLIIYNKTFNKSDCFIGSKEKSYIKSPRMRFILIPKYKKEYNPTCIYGKDNDFIKSKKCLAIKKIYFYL